MVKKLISVKIIIVLTVGMLLGTSSGASAQELLVPPQMELPPVPSAGSGTRTDVYGPESYGPSPSDSADLLTPDPSPENGSRPISSGDLQPSLEPFPSAGDVRILDCEPALLESTGTWLRRGFWYSEIDAVILDRHWSRDGFTLAFQQTAGATGSNRETLNQLTIDGGRTGAEAMPRLKLGRFLFRDHKNRDHAAEFIAYGGGQWSTGGRLDAVPGGTLSVGFGGAVAANGAETSTFRTPLDQGNISFDGATSMNFDYESRFNNFELNYHVKNRMRRDRMELEPSGHWVRRAQSSGVWSLMAGLRYFNLGEDFNWNAFGIDNDNNAATDPQTGTYRISTDNDLIGSQLGGSWTYETARWSLGLQTKGGMFLNHSDVHSNFEVTGGVTSGNNDITVDNLSFITEGSVLGKWHLRPNFSLRAGLEVLYVSSIALAAEQINFIPVSTSQIVGNGSTTFLGGSIGFESYW